MKTCSNCGKEIKRNTKFCVFCGAEQKKVDDKVEKTEMDEVKVDTTIDNQIEGATTTKTSKTEKPKKRSSQWILGICILLFGIWGLHKYMTYLPTGQTDPFTVLAYTAKRTDVFIMAYGSGHEDEFFNNDYVIYLNKNQRTGKLVFPVKGMHDWRTHYCYLVTVGNGSDASTLAVDIKNVKWSRFINDKVAKVTGNNPYSWTEKMSIQYYSDHVSDLDEASNNNFK
ncbi:zinc ribbon domain-containing protein [Lactiplantibacillus herbarum]|uniref:zinc ribbon domain-containing protein n=1 Tax=Lactiplantibacillus herbarum TaxID=1670446 RepID=UPI00064F6AF3